MTPDLDDHSLARAIAFEAGLLLLAVAEKFAGDPVRLKAEGDLQSHNFIVATLSACRPADGLLSEEGSLDSERLTMDRVWIVDPLDGTREFSEGDRSDWAVHVAMVTGGMPTVGAVALPALGVTFDTGHPPQLQHAGDGPVRILVSRTRPSPMAEALASSLHAELIPMGSAGAKAMAVVRGAADVYAHSGGQYEWDSAAPVAVAAAAGLHVSRLDGSPLQYNRANPWLPDLLICRRELAERVLSIIVA